MSTMLGMLCIALYMFTEPWLGQEQEDNDPQVLEDLSRHPKCYALATPCRSRRPLESLAKQSGAKSSP